LRLRTFGGLAIESDSARLQLGPRRLALLAVVAAAGRKGISRDRLVGLFWPESGEEQARHTLSQTLHSLKKDSGRDWIAVGAELRLDPGVSSDVGDFLDATASGKLAVAAALYDGPFLHGIYLPGVPEFERWVETERGRLHALAVRTLETLAVQADGSGQGPEALRWWHRLTELDPLSGRFAAGLMRALAASGDRSSALAHARVHEEVVRRELDTGLDPAVQQLVASLRAPAALPHALPPIPVPALPRPSADSVNPVPASLAAPPERVVTRHNRRTIGVVLLIVAALVVGLRALWPDPGTRMPFLAVGAMRSPDLTDTAVPAGVLRDMLATSLGRIGGLRVVANSRLMELMPRGADTMSGATTDAARRAGATELIEGEIQRDLAGLVMTFRRVAIETGIVVQGYQVRAADRYALVDSATAALARDLHLEPPRGAVADVRTASPAAYALYEEGLRAYYQYDGAAAYRLMTAALERDSTFAMAAYYAWMAGRGLVDEPEATKTFQLAKRLAPRASDRERLLIEGAVAALDAPIYQAVAIAETLSVRYPLDPDGQILLGEARFQNGEWASAVTTLERAVAIDSMAGATGGSYCRICTTLAVMTQAYLWWDSAGAAERSARRLIALRPQDHVGWSHLVEPLLRQGRRAEAAVAAEQGIALSMARFSPRPNLDRDLLRWGRFDEADRMLRDDLRSPSQPTRDEAGWLLWISLRYQGRLREAQDLGSDPSQVAIVALEMGRPAEAGRRFEERAQQIGSSNAPQGLKARLRAWMLTLAGTAWGAAGDTATVRRLVDSVQAIGAASSFGRDGRLHYVLRGLLLQQQGRHAEAVEAFRNGIFSLTDGYTVTNLLMARSLLALGRAQEAIAVLRPALRGGVDGSNTYTSRTELHEALAEAFDLAGIGDSAASHYAAVEKAWRHTDPNYSARYQRVRDRIGAR